CCKIRASKSAEPPAANGTTMVTRRCGQGSCAGAGAKTTAASTGAAKIARMPILQGQMTSGSTGPPVSHRLQMRISPLVQVVVGVAHRLGLAAPDHDLEIDRLEAVVLVAVDDAGRA